MKKKVSLHVETQQGLCREKKKNHPVSNASVSLSFLLGSFILSVRQGRIMMTSKCYRDMTVDDLVFTCKSRGGGGRVETHACRELRKLWSGVNPAPPCGNCSFAFSPPPLYPTQPLRLTSTGARISRQGWGCP